MYLRNRTTERGLKISILAEQRGIIYDLSIDQGYSNEFNGIY